MHFYTWKYTQLFMQYKYLPAKDLIGSCWGMSNFQDWGCISHMHVLNGMTPAKVNDDPSLGDRYVNWLLKTVR